jgi:hypothetical protein
MPAAAVACASAVAPSPVAKRCGVCGRTYPLDAWKALPEVATLPAASVRPHLSIPADWAIDLRSCACGAVLAARRR